MITTRQSSRAASFEPTVESANVESLVEQRLSPGMLVLSPPMQLIHMNHTAWELIQRMSEEKPDQGNEAGPRRAKGLLPGLLRDVCLDIMNHLCERPHAKDWERFELKRLIIDPIHPVLVRGFGVPDPSLRGNSRVVLLLEEVGRKREAFRYREETIEHFHLTEREKGVVQCLAKGWTNKEIAGALGLALPTVKEHIRHIMEKTKTSTRTGILVEIFYK